MTNRLKIIELATVLSCGLFSPISQAADSSIDPHWLASLGNIVPNSAELPSGLQIIPIGITSKLTSTPIEPKLSKQREPSIYKLVTKRVIISPERLETLIIPAIHDKSGNILISQQTKVVMHPPVFGYENIREIVSDSTEYEVMPPLMFKRKIHRKLVNIHGYALIDKQKNIILSWSYIDGNLKLDKH